MNTPKAGIIFLGGIEPRHIKKGDKMTYVDVIRYEPNKQYYYWQIQMNQ